MDGEDGARQSGPKPRDCGCKGIRSCRLCSRATATNENKPPVTTYHFCVLCRRAWKKTNQKNQPNICQDQMEKVSTSGLHPQDQSHGMNVDEISSLPIESKELFMDPEEECTKVTSPVTPCSHEGLEWRKDFEGVVIIEDFVTEKEEIMLNNTISETTFVNSQSGRRKQDFGPKVNFKKQKIRTANFNGLPSYSQFLYERMKVNPTLANFEPVELCNLEYTHARGAHIDPHFDDSWLWGERLVTLNLLSDSVLTFTLDSDPDIEVRVPLLQRSLITVSGAARYQWKHSIKPEDILNRRLAMTFRELSEEFTSGGGKAKEGMELLQLALTFQGCAVGS